MALTSKGRGTIITTGDGQGDRRMRIEFNSYMDGYSSATAELPILGYIYEFNYYDEDDHDADFDDPGIETQTDAEDLINPSGSGNEGKLARYYKDDQGNLIVTVTRNRAHGTVNDQGTEFTVTDARTSGAVNDTTYPITRLSSGSYTTDSFPYDPETRNDSTAEGVDPNMTWEVPFDANNGDGSIDYDPLKNIEWQEA